MDKNRFDGFTRQLAKRENRRQAIKTLFAGGVGTAATVLATGETSAAKTDCCPADRPTLCNLTCTDTIYDEQNCGGCGLTCGVDEQCYKGICESTSIVHCAVASDCPGTDTDCAKRTCKKNICGISYTANGKKIATQIDGDCQKDVCDGAGNVITVTDNTDKPAAQGECWTGICVDGVAQQDPRPAGRNCATGKCDGAGNCSGGCVTAGDCPGSDTECQTRTCTGGTCGVGFAPSGTPLAAQTAGDCLRAVCDGAGGTTTEVDDTDPPLLDYSYECFDSICTNGVPSQTPKSAGLPCSMGVCDGAGVCVECVVSTDCTGIVENATTFCDGGTCSYTCNAGFGDCQPGPGGCETSLMTDPNNCGACGQVCQAPNALMGCAGGECTLVACDSGFGDCNANAADGCEVDILNDSSNCGSCGNVCDGGNVCQNGFCSQ